MKKFQEQLKEKAHLQKIRQAKKTIGTSAKFTGRMASSKVGTETRLLLQLFENKSYNSIPAYKLLRTVNLQQYTKGFIVRGYGINLGKLALLSEKSRRDLYEDLKVMPGHAVKLDNIIDSVAKASYWGCDEASSSQKYMRSESGSSVCEASDKEYEKQLQRVLDEYTPQSSQNKHNRQEVSAVKEFLTSKRTSECMNSSETKFAKTRNNQRLSGFKKKPLEGGTGKPTIRKGTGGVGKNGRAGDGPRGLGMSSAKVMEINLELDKVKAMNKSFDGALMSSTIANIDIEELVFAFAGLVVSRIVVAEEPKIREEIACGDREGKSECIEDQVSNILRESYMHPLYRQQNTHQVEEEIECGEETYSDGDSVEDDLTEVRPKQKNRNEFSFEEKLMESSFLGTSSVHFGVCTPLQIFEQPQPSQIDYFKPTVDSVSNFIKNVILAAKMQRQIPIMAAVYLEMFLDKASLQMTSLNYKRLLVTVLLLSSKIWDDQSFETPSFSKTFPQYSTVLLNEMEKQVVKFLDYKLKLDKKEYSRMYFQLRKFIKGDVRSYQNKQLALHRIREMQAGLRRDYRSHFLTKRKSF